MKLVVAQQLIEALYQILVIGKNTFIDNQVHIAHNNKIGENCIIAGQVGFAGSSIIGNNVMIGGQAGISGHLKNWQQCSNRWWIRSY